MSESDDNPGGINMERNALEILVSALLNSDFSENRLEKLEEAVIMALLALEDTDYSKESTEELKDSLDTLAIQLIASKLKSEDLSIYRVSIDPTDPDDPDGQVQVVAASHPILLGMINHGIEQLTKEFDEFDIN